MTDAEIYSQAITTGAVAELPRAKFKLNGADRERYLNGQVSNDLRKLTPTDTLYACVMTAKGKMCADVFVMAGEDHLLVDADPSLQENLAARLERYIISDDVTIEDVTDELSLIHYVGTLENAPEELKNEGAFQAKRKSRRFGRDGWDLLVKRENFPGIWSALAKHYAVATPAVLESLRIEAGIPRWNLELDENTIPVEAGLDKTAIDYHKGCYMGQEVISRLKSIGHVNRELRGFISRDGQPLQPGMRLESPDAPGKDAGTITSTAYSFALEKPVALGYLKRGISVDALDTSLINEAGEKTTRSILVKELPLIP